jgi:hypothetical protein
MDLIRHPSILTNGRGTEGRVNHGQAGGYSIVSRGSHLHAEFTAGRFKKSETPTYFAGKKIFGGAKVGLHISVAQSSACIIRWRKARHAYFGNCV